MGSVNPPKGISLCQFGGLEPGSYCCPCHCIYADWLLIMQSSREELLDDIEELKKKVTGASDKLSS